MRIKVLVTALLLNILLCIVSAYSLNAKQGDITEAGSMDGSGMVVAVIDGGFSFDLDIWNLTDESTAVITEDDIKELSKKLNATGKVYHSAKLPLVYDYYSGLVKMGKQHHSSGNNAASLIGGNTLSDTESKETSAESIKYSGIAPEAQLLLMNVLDPYGSQVSLSAVEMAIQDAVTLKADVIYIRCLKDVGYSDGTLLGEKIYGMLNEAERNGIFVVSGAGDSGRSGKGSIYGYYDIDLPVPYITDYGTINEPASYPSVMASAAFESYGEYALCIQLDDMNESQIRFSDSTSLYIEPKDKGFDRIFDGQTIEYAMIPGLGSDDDFKDIDDLTGKIAVISRGDITFVEKITNAAEKGAVGVIIYDNIDEPVESIRMDLTDCTIPAILISLEDSKKFIGNENKPQTITVNADAKVFFTNEDAGKPLSSSSYGVTSDLKLKPDISAVGEYKSVDIEGNVVTGSGTSMSAAAVAANAVLLKQVLIANGNDASPEHLRLLMMNGAVPYMCESSGTEYSPRVQGAGEVNIENSLNAPVLITSADGEPRLNIGDKLGRKFNFSLKLENLTDETQNISLSASLFHDAVCEIEIDDGEKVLFTDYDSIPFRNVTVNVEKSLINLSRSRDKYREYAVVLKSGESCELSVSVTLSKEDRDYIEDNFRNGTYIDGYIYAYTGEDKPEVSIPLMGYYGDWNSMDVFDGTVYDGDESFYGDTFFLTHISSLYFESDVVLGKNIYDDEMIPESRLVAVSPNGDGNADELNMVFTTLRNISSSNYRIYNSKGRLVFEYGENGNINKTYVTNAYYNEHYAKMWDCSDRDNPEYIYPDGIYTFVMTGTLANDGAEQNEIVLPFIIDTENPVLENCSVRKKNDRIILSITVRDNYYLQAMTLYESHKGESSKVVGSNDVKAIPVNAEKPGSSYTAEYDITDVESQYLYIDVMDYAFNVLTERINLNGLLQSLPS